MVEGEEVTKKQPQWINEIPEDEYDYHYKLCAVCDFTEYLNIDKQYFVLCIGWDDTRLFRLSRFVEFLIATLETGSLNILVWV